MPWTCADSAALYRLNDWGRGYFAINDEGHVVVTPPNAQKPIDLHVLATDLEKRGIALPVLLRFDDLVKARVDSLVGAFNTAIREYGYQGQFRGVYPVKVNQQRSVVDSVVRCARPHHLGLEAGSKPELLIVLALLDDPEALIICNGYKDRDFIRMALIARKLGKNCIIVIEQPEEVALIIEESAAVGVPARVGLRAKLQARGSGRWEASSGDRAKFGLSVPQLVTAVDQLREAGCLDALKLLHFHIGSQVTDIRAFKNALREAGRVYVELAKMGAPMGYLDVGGGLAVDYDGSKTDSVSSMNYDLQEYAYDVVSAVHEACTPAGVPHPHLVTESGRATVAHNSVLLFEVMGESRTQDTGVPEAPEPTASQSVKDLYELYKHVTDKNLHATWHDAVQLRDETLLKFSLGLATLRDRARVESLFWAICRRMRQAANDHVYLPDDLSDALQELADIYYANFSLFQSAPDVWAIGQLFPVMPIHRLNEEPTRRAVLADLTCDSDGKLDRFIGDGEAKRTLEVHSINGASYVMGIFLLGAYQEILGDLHNLFGDTNTVHVGVAENAAGYRLHDVIEGDCAVDALGYVGYERKPLIGALRAAAEAGIEDGRVSLDEGKMLVEAYRRALDEYTYLT